MKPSLSFSLAGLLPAFLVRPRLRTPVTLRPRLSVILRPQPKNPVCQQERPALSEALAPRPFWSRGYRARTRFFGPYQALRMTMVGIALAGLQLATSQAEAADPLVTNIKIQGPATVTVGDHFKLVITVEADAATQVSLAAGTLPQTISLIGLPRVASRDAGGGRAEITLTAEVAAFFVGDAAVGPIKLDVRGRDGGTSQISTPPLQITVASTVADAAAADPRPLKPQAEIAPVGARGWVFIGGAVLLVLLVTGLGLTVWWRRRRGHEVAAEPEPAAALLGPEDRARRELDETAATYLAGREFAPYYAVLATTIRRYLTERFEFPAFALTTVELQNQMVRRGLDRWQARLVGGLLEQCDAVVFAGYRPAPGRADTDLTAAYEIVEISRRPEPEEAVV
jgi:hypothetical protein